MKDVLDRLFINACMQKSPIVFKGHVAYVQSFHMNPEGEAEFILLYVNANTDFPGLE